MQIPAKLCRLIHTEDSFRDSLSFIVTNVKN